jgi:uncharacterized protein YkwD
MARRPTLRRTPGLERLEGRELLSGASPDALEQYMLVQLNHARTSPTWAAERYTNSSNLGLDTQQTVGDYNVDLNAVRQSILSSGPKQPLAWDPSLAAAAQQHSQDMVNNNYQSHTGSDGSSPGTRIARAGYSGAVASAENAFAYADSVDNAMDAFLIDWGTDGGHRRNILQPDLSNEDSFRQVGLGIVDSSNGLGVGPVVVTQELARTANAKPFVLGVVYNDGDHNGAFSPGEGLGGVDIEVTNLDTGQVVHTQTWDAGGYQVAVDPNHSYKVTARLGSQVLGSQTVQVGDLNVEADFTQSGAPAPASSLSASSSVSAAISPAPVAFPGPIVAPQVVVNSAPAPQVVTNSAPAPQVAANPTPAPQVVAAPTPAPQPVVNPTPTSAPTVQSSVALTPAVPQPPVVIAPAPSQPQAVTPPSSPAPSDPAPSPSPSLPFGPDAIVVSTQLFCHLD